MNAFLEKQALAAYDDGEVERKAGRTDAALSFYETSMTCWEQLAKNTGLAIPPASYLAAAKIHDKQGKTAQAVTILQRHVRLCSRGNDRVKSLLRKLEAKA